MILDGMLLTLKVAIISLIISTIIGLFGAIAKLSNFRIAKVVATIYTTLIRGIPDLVLMTIIFFGGQILVNNIVDSMGWEYIDVSPFIAGTLTIGFIFGAYMTETFRGAMLSVSKEEIEAAKAFGLTNWKIFSRITLPLMARHAIPGFGNNWMVLVKTTALVSVIGLQDMVYNANVAGGSTRQPFTFFLVVAILFLCITAISDFGLRLAKIHFRTGVRKI